MPRCPSGDAHRDQHQHTSNGGSFFSSSDFQAARCDAHRDDDHNELTQTPCAGCAAGSSGDFLPPSSRQSHQPRPPGTATGTKTICAWAQPAMQVDRVTQILLPT
jgi:hypothetical protein